MPKQFNKNMRLMLIVVVTALMLLFSGCAPAASPVPAPTTAAPAATATPTLSPSPTPTVVLTPTATPTPTPTPAPTLPPVPENFIVEDEYWEFALFLHDPSGPRVNGYIAFTGFPEGMKLYAPMSGYLMVLRGDNPYPHATVVLSEVAVDGTNWDNFGPTTGRYIKFSTGEIELLDAEVRDDALYVKKGKPFAEVTKKAELWPGVFEEKIELMVYFQKEWADMLDVSIGDPREYVWSAIQLYEREGGN